MGILDKITSIAEKAIKSVEKTSNKVVDVYKKEGIDGLLERADKGLENLEQKASQVTEKATSYAKDISKSNKVEIEKVKKQSNDDLSTVFNSGVAVAVNTVSTIARDVAKKAKDIVVHQEAQGNTDSFNKDEVKINAFERLRFSKADEVSLESVLKFIGAKQNSEKANKFIDSYNNDLSVQGNAWYDWSNSIGGTGAVSLLKYELDLSYRIGKEETVSQEVIERESISILEQIALSQQVLTKEVEPMLNSAAKKVVKKPTVKKLVTVKKSHP